MDACILKFQICKPKVGVHAVWCDLHAADHCPHSCSHVGSDNHSVGSSNWSLTIFKSCSTTITHTGIEAWSHFAAHKFWMYVLKVGCQGYQQESTSLGGSPSA